jgi:HYR domain
VQDTTPPTLALPSNIDKVEATGPGGAPVSFTATAWDIVDGAVPVVCNPASGSTFPLATTALSCSSTDAHGNTAAGSFTIQVVDTTPPAIAHDDVTAEATGPGGADVVFTVEATDLVDGKMEALCFPTPGSKFPLGETLVTCNATDAHENKGTGSFTVSVVDTTPPVVSVPSDTTTGPTQWNGAIVSYPPASAYDLVDTVVQAVICDPASATLFPFGTTTVTCSATDSHKNTGTNEFKVTVTGFTFLGFFKPIDNLPVMNTVKGGSTVPVKWRLQGQGGIEITDVAAVDAAKLDASPIPCSSAVALDLEFTMTGGTSLRYDPMAPQYILNWQTPRQPGTCWELRVPFVDGTVQRAQFRLK